jgi:hypothetical protein
MQKRGYLDEVRHARLGGDSHRLGAWLAADEQVGNPGDSGNSDQEIRDSTENVIPAIKRSERHDGTTILAMDFAEVRAGEILARARRVCLKQR